MREQTHATSNRPKPNGLRYILIIAGIVVAVCTGVIVVGYLRKAPASTVPAATAETSGSTTAPATPPTIRPAESSKPSVSAPPPPLRLTTAQIAELGTPSVVIVENYNEDGEKAGQGSGYVFSSDGVVITNYHVVRGAQSLAVRAPSRDAVRVDSLLGYSIQHDVAAIQIRGAFLPALITEAREQVKVGDHVTAIGAPFGLESTVSEGIVSAVREGAGIHIIQTTASISPRDARPAGGRRDYEQRQGLRFRAIQAAASKRPICRHIR
jgi:S1-C subfamily serine protease